MASHASIPIDQLLAHREWVRRAARAIVRDENDADDLEQALWLEVLQHPPRGVRSLRGWVSTALRRDRFDLVRASKSRAHREAAVAPAEAVPSAEELVAIADAHARVAVAVMELAEPYRSTVLYRFFEGLPPSGIAARQGVPVETVRTRLKRALGQLRARFDGGSNGDRGARRLALLPLLRRPSTEPAVVGAGASTATGVLLMGIKTKVAAAVVVLLLLVVSAWHGQRREDGDRSSATVPTTPAADRPAPREHPRARRELDASPIDDPRATTVTAAQPVPDAGAPAPATSALAGRVVEADGEPAAGVAVALILRASPRSERVCSTDAAGRFELRDVEPGEYRAEARPVARGPVARELVLPRDAAPAEVELRLAPSRRLTVFVVDEASRPVRGAPVTVRHEWAGTVSGLTDEAGAWSVRFDGAGTVAAGQGGSTRTVGTAPSAPRIERPGWTEEPASRNSPETSPTRADPSREEGTGDVPRLIQPAPIVIASDTETVRVVLRDAGTATGFVLDPDGAPLAGASLDVLVGGSKRRSIQCDAAGAFRVDVAMDETVDLVLDGKSFVDGRTERLALEGRADGVRGGDRNVVLRTSRESLSSSIEVRVLGPAGSPVEGARVWASGALGEVYASSHTDGRGFARLERLPARGLRLWVDTSSLPRASRFALHALRDVHPTGQTVEVRLAAAVTITGTVTDAAGSPAPGAAVSAVRGEKQVAIAFAAEDGTFELSLPPDASGVVTVRASRQRADGTRATAEQPDVPPGTQGVRLELPAK